MTHSPHLSAREAADALGVSQSTLYAYVSRGMLRSEPDPSSGRGRRYPREDVERLLARKAARRDPETAAGDALDFGLPVVDSELTLIADGRLVYRGHDALELARERSLEEVAALLWAGELGRLPDAGPEPGPPTVPTLLTALAELASHQELGAIGPIERCQALLPLASAADPAAWDLRPSAGLPTARRILGLVASGLAGIPAHPEGVAATLAAGWGVEPFHRRALDAALVLSADHELNVSAFTARAVASAGASLYDAVAAALAALKGHRHGGMTARVAALLDEVELRGARRAVEERLRRGETVPGFGHALYPSGDPRARRLLEVGQEITQGGESADARERLAPVLDLVEAAGEILRERPTLDVGLVALARVLALPPEAPMTLFAAGRTAGWLAHALEEAGRGRLIRPRARYVGRPPG